MSLINCSSSSTGLDPVRDSKMILFNGGADESDDMYATASYEKMATFLRIRPLETISLEETPYSIMDSNLLYVKIDNKDKGKNKFVNFAEIFDESAGQKAVFTRTCSPLVHDVLDGTDAFLFCYGTTSSGKSYTMRGPHDDPLSDPGLIPLSLKKIFTSRRFNEEPAICKAKFCEITILDRVQQEMDKCYKASILSKSSQLSRNVNSFTQLDKVETNIDDDYQYVCYISYFEIYNNLIYDLLIPTSEGRGPSLQIFPDEEKRYFVKDLKSIMVSSLSEALQIYSFGWTNLQRNIKETGLNKNSSRSHSFLCITIIKYKEEQGRITESQVSHLTLGDLAGSERQSKTQSEGIRVREGGNINVSLMHLKDCFNKTKLSQKTPCKNYQIPFRNSNLTKFFQPYLTGNGRVWMIININPSPNLLNETCGSLDLGETASSICINSNYQSKLEESKRRVTQMWLQSSQGWSSFVSKPKIEISEVIPEEENEVDQVKPDELVDKLKSEIEMRNEMIESFQKILADIQSEHEMDLEAMRENYESTLEARLALSERKHQPTIEYLQEQIDDLNDQLFDEREKNVLNADIIVECRKKIEELSSQLTETKSENAILKDEVANLAAKQLSPESEWQEIEDLKNQLRDERQKNAQLGEEVRVINELRREKNMQHIEDSNTINEQRQELEKLKSELAEEKEKNAKLADKIRVLESASDSRLATLEMKYHQIIGNLEEEIDGLKGQLLDEQEKSIQFTDNSRIITELRQKLEELNNRLEEEKANSVQLGGVISGLESEIEESKKKIEEVERNLLEETERRKLQELERIEIEELLKKRVEEMEKMKAEEIERRKTEESERMRVEALERKRIEKLEKKMNEEMERKLREEKEKKKLEEAETRLSSETVQLEAPPSETPIKKSIDSVSTKVSRIISLNTNPVINTNFQPLSKKKKAKGSNESPSSSITCEYLKRFCPPSTAKKSVQKSARKAPKHKITKKEEEPEEELDEISELLNCKENSKNGDEVPTKRKKLPTQGTISEFNISNVEDEPEPENIKGGRVLRPRRKIKF